LEKLLILYSKILGLYLPSNLHKMQTKKPLERTPRL
jgi:hypothetical protein